MFENPDYQVDEQSEEFRLLNPIVSKVEQKRKKKLRLLAQQATAAQQVMQKSSALREMFFCFFLLKCLNLIFWLSRLRLGG